MRRPLALVLWFDVNETMIGDPAAGLGFGESLIMVIAKAVLRPTLNVWPHDSTPINHDSNCSLPRNAHAYDVHGRRSTWLRAEGYLRITRAIAEVRARRPSRTTLISTESTTSCYLFFSRR